MNGTNLLTEDQKKWHDFKKLIKHMKPARVVIEPKNKFRSLCFRVYNNKWYQRFNFIVIIFQVIVMASDFNSSPLIFSAITSNFL